MTSWRFGNKAKTCYFPWDCGSHAWRD